MKVSVLICTRDRPQDIIWALPSVLKNIYPDYEVVVVDQSDGDATGEIVRPYRGDYPNLRYVPSETRGLSAARNLAMSLASGEVIAFTDDDCQTSGQWVSDIARLFTQEPDVDMVFGQVHQPNDLPAGDLVVPCLYFSERRVLTTGMIFGMGANMAFRRSVFEQLGGYDPLLGAGSPFGGGEDFDFTYRAQRAGVRIVAEPTLFLTHRSYRERSQWHRVQEAYGMGDAAFEAKHARCGDVKFLKTIFCTILSRGVRGLVKGVLGRHNPEAVYVRGFCHGIRKSLRYPVDRRTRLYVGA